ncbi:MAG: hypothetical protein L3J39_05455 [Verrucomicrobiales bacterium]|nr:hypothetical protein [Verrucomicrobiales bacterium]
MKQQLLDHVCFQIPQYPQIPPLRPAHFPTTIRPPHSELISLALKKIIHITLTPQHRAIGKIPDPASQSLRQRQTPPDSSTCLISS